LHTKPLLLLTIILILLSLFPHPTMASDGLPNTATFGYGARLDMWGQDVFTAMELASQLGLEWVGVDVDWARHWPSLDQAADFSALDYVLQSARQKDISVLLSLTNPPAWALSASGPEPNYTNALIQSILNVYSDVIEAIELFPGMNSAASWGATPNPQAYLTMLQTVRQGCDAAGRTVYLVTTIEPLLTVAEDGSLDDRIFLENLYNLNGMPFLPIIGIRYQTIMGAPMSDQSDLYPIVLRHYEYIRALMLQHQHARGMIWITGFSWPTTGTTNPAEPLALPTTPDYQGQWVNQAYQLLQAQLFIGAAFFDSLNQSNPPMPAPALLLPGRVIHLATVMISRFAGGSITSTDWTAPQTPGGPNPSSTSNTSPGTDMTCLRYEGKPRK
jgi:hypothetical protein